MTTMNLNNWEGVLNLAHVLKHSAQNYPSNTALTSVDGTSYNYKEVELAARYTATLLQKIFIKMVFCIKH